MCKCEDSSCVYNEDDDRCRNCDICEWANELEEDIEEETTEKIIETTLDEACKLMRLPLTIRERTTAYETYKKRISWIDSKLYNDFISKLTKILKI